MLLFEKLSTQGWQVILASQSPRRRELMQGSGIPFSVMAYDIDESYPPSLDKDSVAQYLSQLKSDNYPHKLEPNQILITADTVVLCQGQILGKPKDPTHAKQMLQQISGREHTVITGVTIRSQHKSVSFSSQSTVHFSQLSSQEIDYYIEHYRPMDKAGSYGIQEWIGYIGIEGIEGSFYNVMGLPIQKLYTELNKFIA